MSDEEKQDVEYDDVADGGQAQDTANTAVVPSEADEGVDNDDGQRSWDQTRQYRDELSAANRREGELKAQLNALEQQKVDAEAAATAANATEEDIGDYDTLVDTVKSLKSELSESRNDRVTLQKQVADIGTQMKQRDEMVAAERANAEGQKMFNDTVGVLGKQYGDKYTNVAVAEAEKAYVEQKIASIDNVEARRSWIKTNLELAFIKAKNKKAAKSQQSDTSNSKNVVLDTGGGGSSPSAAEIKEGTLDDVLPQLRAKWAREGG